MKQMFIGIMSLLSLVLAADDALPDLYVPPTKAHTIDLRITGSPEFALEAEQWRQVYTGLQHEKSRVRFRVEAKGNTFAVPSVIEATAHLGMMSRELKAEELAAYNKHFGAAPVTLPVAYQVYAVVVHPENPIKSISLQELDAIFSADRKRGHPKALTRWGDLGLEGEWADKAITPCIHNSSTAAYGYTKKHLLLRGNYSKRVVPMRPGMAVSRDRSAIALVRAVHVGRSLKALAVSDTPGEDRVALTHKTVKSGAYPSVVHYFLLSPPKPDPATRDFLRFLYKHQGQQIIKESWLYPLDKEQVQENLLRVEKLSVNG